MKQLDRTGEEAVYIPVRMPLSLKNEITQMAHTTDQSVNRTVVELIMLGLEHTV